ncbi:Magnesium-transporting ATPase, P-type 1 [Lachnellula suecica]|uniref:Magnesium-transporting ATPase, P-type 1 n=1 Tax=Lachnellula suecica TaxID=602035 RepID=A0A8T9CDE6_9HELO|nr:Magnesium-transporting ATPase, P-type 1 [Lachnellula suecica]
MPFQIKSLWAQPQVTAISRTDSDQTIGSLRSDDVLMSEMETGAPAWLEVSSANKTSYETAFTSLAAISGDEAVKKLGSSKSGLDTEEAAARLKTYGENVLSSKKPPTKWQLALSSLLDWFNGILVVIGIVTLAMPEREYATAGIIFAMIVAGCIIRFWQENRSAEAAIELQDGVAADVRVRRRNDHKGEFIEMTVDQKYVVPGDVIVINPGDTVPADCRVLQASNLSVSQSSLDGESEPKRKDSGRQIAKADGCLHELENIIFMGTHVISGSGLAVVLRTGDNAYIATSIMKKILEKRPQNAFQRGIKQLSWAMIVVIFVVCPIVFAISWMKNGNLLDDSLFAVSVAVGLMPQMLPAIINSNLARGAYVLNKKSALVKRLPSLQNLGAMTVLCSDKTGTLTKDEIALCDYLEPEGKEHLRVFTLAHANAAAQSGAKNSIDAAILKHPASEKIIPILGQKVGEIAFTFEARRSSGIFETAPGKHLLVCKGAYEEVLALCSRIRLQEQTLPLSDAYTKDLNKRIGVLNAEGYRVVLLATREIGELTDAENTNFDRYDAGMTIEGFLTFLDPPKEDARVSIARLHELEVDVRVLTGDNLGVALKVCRDLEIVKRVDEVDDQHVQAITGPQLSLLDETEFHETVKHCKIFAKLTPTQKGDVINSLRERHNHVVGMLGDGVNDSVALRVADAGISVDTGANVAKDCADVILTKKELSIVVDAVRVGRTTQGNTIKYIKVVFSSNFGNILSILIATSWLDYQPMTSLQILLGGLLYECSQLAIPWDHMDDEYLAVPSKWSVWDLTRFMGIQGPISSLVDIFTFCLNWYYYNLRDGNNKHDVRVARTQWYLQGLLTQILIVHLMRTSKIPFVQSRPAKQLVCSSIVMLAIGFSLPYIGPIAHAVEFERPNNSFLGFLVAEMAFYAVLVEITKRIQLKYFKRWL